MNNQTPNDSSYAGEYLRRLLTEEATEAPDLTRLNGYGSTLHAIYEAKLAGGLSGAKRAYEALSNNIPDLKVLARGKAKRFYHADELHQIPRPEYLPGAKPLYRGCMNLLVGQSGAGKSFVALDLALIVAQYATVIYVAAEGAGGYQDRVTAWKLANKQSAGKLFFAPMELQIVKAPSVQAFVESVQEFLETVHHLLPQLVVIDTLARCFGDGDENAADDMGAFVNGLSTIQTALNTATLTLHHTTKAGNTERGSSALRSACDSVTDLQETDGLIKLVNSKNKYGKEVDDILLRLVDFTIEEGRTCPAVMPAEKVVEIKGTALTKQQRAILESLALETFREIGAKSATVGKVTGIGDNSLFHILSKLKKQGYVSQGAKGDPFKITAEGLKAIGQ